MLQFGLQHLWVLWPSTRYLAFLSHKFLISKTRILLPPPTLQTHFETKMWEWDNAWKTSGTEWGSVSGRCHSRLRVKSLGWKCLLKWLRDHFFLCYCFFLSLVYCHTMVPEIDIFYKYQLHQILSRKTASLSQDDRGYWFGRYYVYSRVPSLRYILVTSSSVTSEGIFGASSWRSPIDLCSAWEHRFSYFLDH